MESEYAERRINTISAHFACANDFSAGASRLLPLNCSSSLSSPVTRYDNRLFFARQGSSNQSCFMKQASMDLGNPSQPGGAFSTYGIVDTYNTVEAPLFSRPAKVVNSVPSFNSIKSVEDDFRSSSTEPPKFARPCSTHDLDNQFDSKKQIPSSKPQNGAQWSPRTNIAESECKYIISMELPGVGIGDIRVEVNAKRLIVMGRRSTTKWASLGCCSSNRSNTTYHKKEILLGPYQFVWPLPASVNKDGISAKFVEGILRISIPKLSAGESRYIRYDAITAKTRC